MIAGAGIHRSHPARLGGVGITAATIASVIALALLAAPVARAADWQRPDSPFTLGEAYPDTPATCATVGNWIDKAPDTDDRVSFAIRGRLASVDGDGALAYLIVCDEPGVQVMCVTYTAEGRAVGETLLVAGGFTRFDERRIVLDPCLASPDGAPPG